MLFKPGLKLMGRDQGRLQYQRPHCNVILVTDMLVPQHQGSMQQLMESYAQAEAER